MILWRQEWENKLFEMSLIPRVMVNKKKHLSPVLETHFCNVQQTENNSFYSGLHYHLQAFLSGQLCLQRKYDWYKSPPFCTTQLDTSCPGDFFLFLFFSTSQLLL